jgi:predicted phage-related endonuclease
VMTARPNLTTTLEMPDRETWLETRQKLVGASEVGCLLGVHDHLTPLELWARKTGRSESVPETAAMRRGSRLEALTLNLLAEENPTWSIDPNPMPGKIYVDLSAHMGATPDALALDPARPGRGNVQVKSVHPRIFRQKWMDEDGLITPPLWIAIQATAEAMLVGAEWSTVAALVVDNGLELHTVDIPHIPGLADRLYQEVAEFWSYVERDEPPPADFARDLAVIKALNLAAAPASPPEINLDDDTELALALTLFHECAAELKDLSARQKMAEAMIRQKMGAHALACCGPFSIRHQRIDRKEYVVKATSYQKLTVTKPGQE